MSHKLRFAKRIPLPAAWVPAAAFCALFLHLFSCGGKSPLQSGGEATVINIYMFASNETYRNVDQVIAEFEQQTRETLNIDIRIHTMLRDDYLERIALIASTGTEADLVFNAPWMNLNSLIQKNVYKELSGYFDNPALSSLRSAFPPAFLDSNHFFGGIYGIPIMNAPLDIPGIYYRKDLADAYGITIQSYDDLRFFFETILREEKGMIPISIQNNRGFYMMFDATWDMAAKGIYPIEGIIGGVRELFFVGLSSDGKRVTGVSAYGDPEDSYTAYPNPYNTFEGFNRYFLEAAKWNVYVSEDSVMREQAGPLFFNGFAAAGEGAVSEFSRWQNTLKTHLPQASIAFWPYIEAARNREKGSIALSFRAWNYLCVPRNSSKTEKVFEFLNWVFESREHNDLFSYGIRGVHWNMADDSSTPVPNPLLSEADRYLFPGYELTWNPRFIRIPAGLPEDVRSLFEYQYAPDAFTRIPVSDFVLDDREIISELANIRVILKKYHNALLCGAYEDPAAILREMNRQMEAAGLAKVKDAIVRQVQDYLDS
ncbi:MAG: extracellular solute-binding protein [Treponema sp.]|jgi:putative aldouronate transport system substrate-binding protein|nr:extracellular solute-binding protein [Treponema sp.]